MNDFNQRLGELTGLDPLLQRRLLLTFGVLACLWLTRRLILLIVARRVDDVRISYQWQKGSAYSAVALGLLVAGRIWIDDFGAFATYLGLVSAGLAIALKDLVTNMAGWMFILWRRPFEVGDRIQIGQHSGDVIDIRIFQFTLLEIGNWVNGDQSTGRVIHIPNGQIFLRPMANATKGFQYIWNELPVLVTFESDWEKAKEILQAIADKHSQHLSTAAQEQVKKASRKFMIIYSKLTPIVYTSVEDSGILLTVRYLSPPRRRRSSAQSIWEDTLRQFAEHDDIDFAYPTQRFYDNTVEGKPGAKADPIRR